MDPNNVYEFIKQFRFKADKPLQKISLNPKANNELFEIHNSLLINEYISPKIYRCMVDACKNLHLSPDAISLYVYNSSEINAKCFNGLKDGFVVMLSSSLVQLLDAHELTFVIGHELGHMLLDHTRETRDQTPEGLKNSRSKEISVDRIGLVACRDINASLRSIIKVSSGLPSKFIGFNTSELLNQLRKTDEDSSRFLENHTHPSFLLRARALVLFSTSDKFLYLFEKSGRDIDLIDSQILSDMDRFIDKSINEKTEDVKNIFNFWLSAFAVTLDGKFSKDEQVYMKDNFGEEKLKKFITMVSDQSTANTSSFIKNKLISSLKDLSFYRSFSIDKDIDLAIKKISEDLKIENLSKKFNELLSK